jgi:hypothetical protein
LILFSIPPTLRTDAALGEGETQLRWTEFEDGEQKLAAFFRETDLITEDGDRPENAPISARRGPVRWKVVSGLVLLAFVAWSFAL